MGRVLACADIGSNTVHMLVGETDGQTVQRIENQSEWLGLGEEVARTGEISTQAAQQLVEFLSQYRAVARASGAKGFYAFATEAVRASSNGTKVLERIRKEDGFPVHVITPRMEAEYSMRGANVDVGPFEEMTFVEVGGGSAQVAIVRKGSITKAFSLPIGTGRLIADAELMMPSTKTRVSKVRREIHDALVGVRNGKWPEPLVGSGGVLRGLWRALHPDGERMLALEEIQYLSWSTRRLSAEVAAQRFNCKLKRAATLLPGALVYECLMRTTGASSIVVSEFGVREGALLAMANGEVDTWLV